MTHHKLPNLTRLTAEMAANQGKVANCVESWIARTDELVDAANDADWPRVQLISRQIAEQGRAAGYRSVSALAQRVHEEAIRPNNPLGVKRSLVRLIGTCGRIAQQ